MSISEFLRAKSLAPNTERSYRHSLEVLGATPSSTRSDLLCTLEGQNGLTVKITALKSYYGWLVDTGQRVDDPTRGIRLPKAMPSVGKGISREQYLRLLESLKNSREIALVGLLFGSGLRAAEVLALDWSDVQGDEVVIRQAKHGSVGKVPINAMTQQALEDLRGDGACFVSESNASRGARLTYTGLHKMIKLIGQRVGIEGLTPHDGRHTFVQWLVEGGLDAYLATALSRHQDIRSYAVYADKVRYQKALQWYRDQEA